MSEAVRANPTAPATPKAAARHQRGPRNAARVASRAVPPQSEPATIHSNVVGTSLPPPGWAKIKNPANPPAAPAQPNHSRQPTRNRNQVASRTTKNTSSDVKMGCTWLSVPRWRATIWRGTVATMKARPRSHTPRFERVREQAEFQRVRRRARFRFPCAAGRSPAHWTARTPWRGDRPLIFRLLLTIRSILTDLQGFRFHLPLLARFLRLSSGFWVGFQWLAAGASASRTTQSLEHFSLFRLPSPIEVDQILPCFGSQLLHIDCTG